MLRGCKLVMEMELVVRNKDFFIGYPERFQVVLVLGTVAYRVLVIDFSQHDGRADGACSAKHSLNTKVAKGLKIGFMDTRHFSILFFAPNIFF